jgi:hypothetical protein
MTDTLNPDYRELAFRRSGGLRVTLLWSEREDRVLVDVSDEQTGEQFVLDAPTDKALETFYHPFAHARLPEAA